MKPALGILMVCLPLKMLYVTSGFGYRLHPVTGLYGFHEGVDLRARHDTVYAILDGRVQPTAPFGAIGLSLRIAHGECFSSYGHLSQVFVLPEDSVAAGQPIGITGETGRVTGEHLHFAVSYHGRFINPLKFLYQLLIKKGHEQKF